MKAPDELIPAWLRGAMERTKPPLGWAWEVELDGGRWFAVMRCNLYAATEVSALDPDEVLDKKFEQLCTHDEIYLNPNGKKYLT